MHFCVIYFSEMFANFIGESNIDKVHDYLTYTLKDAVFGYLFLNVFYTDNT